MIGFIERGFLASHHRRPALEILDTWRGKFHAHQAGNRATHDSCKNCKDQIERADIFMVRRHEPTGEKARLVIRVVMVMRVEVRTRGSNRGHPFGLLSWLALQQVQQLC